MSDDIKVKPRYVNRTGTPTVRTPVDYMGNEIVNPNLKGEKVSNENRTTIVKKRHETKYKSKSKTSKQKLKNK